MNIKKFLSGQSANLILLFLIFTILPFIILSVYVHPCWDDFEYSEIAYKNGFFHSQYIWYVTWSGRFFSTAVLSSLNPLIYRSILGYKVITLIFILLFIVSVYYLVNEIASGKISIKQKLICTLSFCYLFVSGLPAPELALFWLASTVIYQLANIMMIVLAALFIRLLHNNKEDISKGLIISVCLLIFAVEGSNEVSMLTTTIFFAAVFAGNYLFTKKFDNHLFIFASAAVISFLLVYLAPGNDFRLSTNPDSHNLIYSLKNSSVDLFKFILYRIYNLPLLIFTVLFISFYYKLLSGKKTEEIKLNISPVYSVLLYLLILFSGIFVSYWSLGTATPYRTLNVIYFIFLLGWFLNIMIIIKYLYAKEKLSLNSVPEYAFVLLCLAVFFSFMKETGSIKLAYRDLLSGKAQIFSSELNERYRNIYSGTSDTIKIDSLSSIPKSFFYYDIGSDPEGKYNKLQSEYFGKKAIIRKE
ncbi:MAG TPA: DUF6056 family protein [Ignavibacteria bacterium]|nr:DUF6056 family protein [Ignavibacteria bacterium]